MGIQGENWKMFTWGLTGVKNILFRVQNIKNAILGGTPPLYTKPSAGVPRGHKSSNRIALS